MKININRNSFITGLFVKQLALSGLRYACISPGSRSTPLTMAFAGNKKIKSFVHIDERSSAFFALGLAKATGIPAALVCTSGTAAVEFYPAVVEAYQQRIPLIICTADRPPDQIGKGANQTINQKNLYGSHIRMSADAGLPAADIDSINNIISLAERSYNTSCSTGGPVHINFPFKKPFEPESYTDSIDKKLISYASGLTQGKSIRSMPSAVIDRQFKKTLTLINNIKKGIIIAGPEVFNKNYRSLCFRFADMTGYPILADVNSNLRMGANKKTNLIKGYDAFLRSASFNEYLKPELILHFGRTPTSRVLLEFLSTCNAKRIMINEYGDWFDPADRSSGIIKMLPSEFCRLAAGNIKRKDTDSKWLNLFTNAEKRINITMERSLDEAPFNSESRLIRDIINVLPDNISLMISNSTPVRDLDNFSDSVTKNVSIFSNRGASGIDGILSTALGLAAGLRKPTALITGDLAFFYDITALLTGKNYDIPLTVIMINNNGGGIFNALPVSKHRNIFNRYFITPHNLEFGPIVKSFGCRYKLIKNYSQLKTDILNAFKSHKMHVLEIKTDAEESLKVRNKFWDKIKTEKFL